MVHELKRKLCDDAESDTGHTKRRATHDADSAFTASASSNSNSNSSDTGALGFVVPTTLRFATESWQGMKPTNEDRHVADAARFPGPVFGVFDGHGGVFTVEFLVRHLLKTLHASLKHHMPVHEVEALTTLRDESAREAQRKCEIEAQLCVCQEQLAQVQQLLDDTDGERTAAPDTADAAELGTSSSDDDTGVNALREQLCSAVRALELALAQIERDDAARSEQFRAWVLRLDPLVKRSLAESFARTDAHVLQKNPSRDGSTALLLWFIFGSSSTPREMAYYYTANLGDCRAVLCRGGHGIPLTADHKPSRPDERQRIVNAGGFVGSFAGVARVYSAAGAGLSLQQSQKSATYLAVSRAFGDAPLKTPAPLVSCEPEIKRFRVERDDLFIVVACDGIWDVLSNQDAVHVALQHFGDAQRAADAIVKEAYRRGSSDNLTATVVQFGWQDGSPQLAHARAASSAMSKSAAAALLPVLPPRFVTHHSRAVQSHVHCLTDAAAAAAAGETTENQDDDDDDEGDDEEEIDMFNL